MPQDPVADRLRAAPVPDAIKASAWDAYESATDPDDLEKRLRALPLPDSVRADLWDMKASAAPNLDEVPQETPSSLSLAGTTMKTAAKDIFVAPFQMAGSLIGNTSDRFGKARDALGRGEFGSAVSEVVQGLPPVAMTRALGEAQLDQFGKARRAQSTSEMVGHTVAGLVPLAGPMAATIGEQIGTGDPEQMAEAAGHSLALLAGPKATSLTARGLAKTAVGTVRAGQRAASTVGRGITGAAEGYAEGGIGGAAAKGLGEAWGGATDPIGPVPLMVKALKPRNTKIKFEDTLETALPQVNRIVQDTGKPITNAVEFLDAVKSAKKAVRAEYDAIQGPRREIGSMVDGTPIADAMVESIPKKTRLENPAKARAIEDLADTYRQAFKLEDMEVLLQDANAELQGFYDKFPMARHREAQFNPEIAPVLAQATEMRNAIYKVLDNPTQTAQARDLQRQYGALMEVENTAQRRTVVANRQQPESLSEQVGQVRAAADIARGLWKLGRGNPMGAADVAAGVAGRQMGKFLKDQQTMDALIRRAMSKYTKVARPIDIPPAPVIRGLLPEPARQMPPPAESGGSLLVRGKFGAPSYTQKMLPERTAPVPAQKSAIPLGPAPVPQTAPTPSVTRRPFPTNPIPLSPPSTPARVPQSPRVVELPKVPRRKFPVGPPIDPSRLPKSFLNPDATVGELFTDVFTDAKLHGYRGSPNQLRELFNDAMKDAKDYQAEMAGADDATALLKAIAKNGGIGGDTNRLGRVRPGHAGVGMPGEIDTLWESSTGMAVGRGYKKGTSILRSSRKLSGGAIGGVSGVVKHGGKNLEEMVEALQESGFSHITEINTLLNEIESARVALMRRGRQRLGDALQAVGVRPGSKWWEAADEDFDASSF